MGKLLVSHLLPAVDALERACTQFELCLGNKETMSHHSQVPVN